MTRKLVKGPRPQVTVELADAVAAVVTELGQERGSPPRLLLPPGVEAHHLKHLADWAKACRTWVEAPRDERGRVRSMTRRPTTTAFRARQLLRVAWWASSHAELQAGADLITSFAKATLKHLEGEWHGC